MESRASTAEVRLQVNVDVSPADSEVTCKVYMVNVAHLSLRNICMTPGHCAADIRGQRGHQGGVPGKLAAVGWRVHADQAARRRPAWRQPQLGRQIWYAPRLSHRHVRGLHRHAESLLSNQGELATYILGSHLVFLNICRQRRLLIGRRDTAGKIIPNLREGHF